MGSHLTRVSITLETNILEQFDALNKRRGIPTRSEAVKQLIKGSLIEQEWKDGDVVAGVITLIYDHHKTHMLDEIVGTQHDFGNMVLCSQHAHLDHHNCMENIIVKGPVKEMQQLFHALEAIKGMKHCSLTMSTTGTNL